MALHLARIITLPEIIHANVREDVARRKKETREANRDKPAM